MTKKDFKRYMCQGLGRCYIHLRDIDDKEKYKDIVLWGCLHSLSYDIQVEGTRAPYVYELTQLFDDDEYFITAIVEKIKKLSSRYHYDQLSHLSNLLGRFAEKGSREALDALLKQREKYLNALIGKRVFRGYDYIRDYFEIISISIIPLVEISALLSDFGRLFVENSHYNADEFDWFCICLENHYGKSRLSSLLKSESKENNLVSAFRDSYVKEIASKNKTVRRKRPPEDIEELADKLLAEPDLDEKAELLFCIGCKKNIPPRIHKDIIEYSKSGHYELSENAIYTLTNCQSDVVHDFALSILDSDLKIHAIEMLLMNYRHEDDELLFSEILKYKIDYDDAYNWHSVTSKIVTAYFSGVKLPRKYIMYVYNNTLCSYCRANAVESLSKRRMLTEDIVEECRYDSNDDIVEYVNRYYKKQR